MRNLSNKIWSAKNAAAFELKVLFKYLPAYLFFRLKTLVMGQ
jgi:hypothetical protein